MRASGVSNGAVPALGEVRGVPCADEETDPRTSGRPRGGCQVAATTALIEEEMAVATGSPTVTPPVEELLAKATSGAAMIVDGGREGWAVADRW